MKISLSFIIFVLLLNSCKKPNNTEIDDNSSASIPASENKTELVYPISLLDSVSDINKTTSWYNTNKSFTQLFNVQNSLYWGFEISGNFLVPYNTSTANTWSATKSYYWNDLGGYLYTDLTGDGKKDLWAYYLKYPWPSNEKGLHLFSEYEKRSSIYHLEYGLTQVRKCVLADLNKDKAFEIVLFSSGYDAPPFPGDSLGIFYVNTNQYQYLKDDIGYFHGGSTGDINNDGMEDIVAYSGGSAVMSAHPTVYINKGNKEFSLSNNIFKGFSGADNFYTLELFDINQDGRLDLFLGGANKFIIITQQNGEFNRQNAISVPIETDLELMDIAFFDFNKDRNLDLLTMSNKAGYQGYGLRLYIKEDNRFIDRTSAYFDKYTGVGTNSWIKWIHLFDYDGDGDIDIAGDGLFGNLTGGKIWWRNQNGKFIQTKQ